MINQDKMILKIASIFLVVLPIISILGNPIDGLQNDSTESASSVEIVNLESNSETSQTQLPDNEQLVGDASAVTHLNEELLRQQTMEAEESPENGVKSEIPIAPDATELDEELNSGQISGTEEPSKTAFKREIPMDLNVTELGKKEIPQEISGTGEPLVNSVKNSIPKATNVIELGGKQISQEISGTGEPLVNSVKNVIPKATNVIESGGKGISIASNAVGNGLASASKDLTICNNLLAANPLGALNGLSSILSIEPNPLITVTIEVHTPELIMLPMRTLNHQPIKVQLDFKSGFGSQTKTINIPLPWDIKPSSSGFDELGDSIRNGSFWKFIPAFDCFEPKITELMKSVSQSVPCDKVSIEIPIPSMASFCDLWSQFESYICNIWNNLSLPCTN